MKIDMLSTSMNLESCKAVKTEDDRIFLDVFNLEQMELEAKEKINSLTEDENDIEDEIMATIAAIIDKIIPNEVNSITQCRTSIDEFYGEKLKDVLGEHNLKELHIGEDIEELLKNLNEEFSSSQNLEKLFNKAIGNNVLNKDVLTKGNLPTLINVQYQNENVHGSIMDYTKVDNSMTLDKKNQIFNIEAFRHRNITVDEKPSDLMGEISFLNSIAFSNENIAEANKDTVPVVVRNEFLATDILKVVKYIDSNRAKELNVKITPKELGEVNIKILKLEDNNELIITLSNKKAYELMKENVSDIQKHLSNLDMKIKDVVIQINNDSYSDFSGSFNEQFNKNNSEEKEEGNSSMGRSSFEEDEDKSEIDDNNINLLV